MNKLSGRISDWCRERRIRDLSRQVAYLYAHGYRDAARGIDMQRMDEIRARSSKQVTRMERKQGLNT